VIAGSDRENNRDQKPDSLALSKEEGQTRLQLRHLLRPSLRLIDPLEVPSQGADMQVT
jgi:hypothetical protein